MAEAEEEVPVGGEEKVEIVVVFQNPDVVVAEDEGVLVVDEVEPRVEQKS